MTRESKAFCPGDKLLVAAEGAVLLAELKELGPKVLVRLVYGDAWLEVEPDRLFALTDLEQASAKGLVP